MVAWHLTHLAFSFNYLIFQRKFSYKELRRFYCSEITKFIFTPSIKHSGYFGMFTLHVGHKLDELSGANLP